MSRDGLFEVKEQLKQIKKELEKTEKLTRVAASAAINRASSSARVEASKLIRQKYKVSSGDVKATFTVRKSSKSQLSYRLASRGSAIPLAKFNVTPKKVTPKRPKVLKASVKKGGAKKGIPHAFIATVSSGHTGVFERVTRKRLPIDQKFGPAVPQMAANEAVYEPVLAIFRDKFSERYPHELDRVFGRL